MFKRTILAAIALSIFAVPMAQAQSRHEGPWQHHQYTQPGKPGYHAPRGRHEVQRPAPRGHHARPAPQRHQAYRPAPPRHQWKQGQRVNNWQRYAHVRDYHRQGLRKPARGQQWVKVDNDYLLISLATGVILGLAASR